MPDENPEDSDKTFDLLWDDERAEKMKKAKQLLRKYFEQESARIAGVRLLKPENEAAKDWLKYASKFIARGRGIAITEAAQFKNEKDKYVDFYEVNDRQVEHPYRAHMQLRLLCSTLASMRGKDVITFEEFETVKPILLSTMQVDRSRIIEELAKTPGKSANELAAKLKLSPKTIRRTAVELIALELIDSYIAPATSGGPQPKRYFILEEFSKLLGGSMPAPENLSLSTGHKGALKEVDNEIDIYPEF